MDPYPCYDGVRALALEEDGMGEGPHAILTEVVVDVSEDVPKETLPVFYSTFFSSQPGVLNGLRSSASPVTQPSIGIGTVLTAMNGAAVVADVIPQPPQHNIPISSPPTSLLSYNISLNFSSIFALLPSSRLLAKLRRHGFLDSANPTPASTAESWAAEISTLTSQQSLETLGTGPAVEQLPAFPGPWAFFTSWYMIGLFIMAILLHRMQNVIIPSRPPTRRSRHAYRFGPTFAGPLRQTFTLQHVFGSLLPLNFSRTATRLILHLPSVYFLCKMLLLWFLLTLQTCEIYPEFSEEQKVAYFGILGGIDRLGKWCSQKDMSEICWETFCAVCVAFLVEGFIKALDGMGSGFPINNVNPNTSPFNLVGYAFLLHVYSSPMVHTFRPEHGASRPDKHAIITISIPLLQLTIFHILSISKRLSTHRLLPTALTSILSLAHFHGTLFSHHLFKPPSPSPLATPTASPTLTATTIARASPYVGRSSISYPLLNYIPNIFETLLIAIILLTIFLNALVQLLVRGRVDRVLSGLGVGQGSVLHEDDEANPGFFRSLPFDEDFGVLLLRVGISSMEATGLRGWGNEVAPINLPLKARRSHASNGSRHPSDRRLRVDGAEQTEVTYGKIRLGRSEVGEVHYGSGTQASTSNTRRAIFEGSSRKQRSRKQQQQLPVRKKGFNNEVRSVDVGNSVEESGGQASRGGWLRWLREVWAFCMAFWGVMKGLVVFLVERAKGKVRVKDDTAETGTRSSTPLPVTKDSDDGEEDNFEEKQMRRDKEVYQRFLRGEDISDDEEDAESAFTEEEEESEDDFGNEGDEDEGEAEAVSLFADFIRNRGSPSHTTTLTSSEGGSGNGEMVLAHLMHGGTGSSLSPLTRRRWNALVRNERDVFARGTSPDVFDDEDNYDLWDGSPPPQMNLNVQTGQQQERVQNACVICTSEERDIICWPCRCLAMCDVCREALASKSAPSKHRCPCCRRIVEGYSRIYIP